MTQYTREQILSMPVGRELDAIAAQLTGYKSLTTNLNQDGTYGTLPRYSEDISAAWDLVDIMLKTHWVDMHCGRGTYDCQTYDCQIGKLSVIGSVHAEADTAPEAITKAAILAMIRRY
ncbi:hypothetical protein [Paenibacillus sp. UMB4589-SE434]|uniref:BC1872 family protein n=1 Tax=Paenibacillus sp. UMB4589-SE434 TaxID=3046314 RepID=UPI0025517663|nr:hypothetical protein [Paenibacillus sp. UMB4589-SE434]MDK8182092.1 hypothetical protein [Paenibacillus sp. UMB4589-SE434]